MTPGLSRNPGLTGFVPNIPGIMGTAFNVVGYKTDVKVNYPDMIFIVLTITNF